jgi:SSS family solute:Na+ symporter
MDWALFIGVLFLIQVVCLYVGGKAAHGQKTNKDYYLASKTVGFFPLMMTLVATQVGGGLVLGASQEAYTYGWSVMLYPLGQSLGFILLGLGFGRKMAESGASTVAELCERAFNSRRLRQTASILSMISLFMIFVAQIIASKKFLTSLGVGEEWIFLCFWALVIGYTVVGGLKGVIYSDIVQASYFIFVFIIALLISSGEYFVSSKADLFTEDPSGQMLGWLLMPMLFMLIEQDMGQRCFAADNPKTVTKAALFAAFVTFAICLIPVYFGVLGKTLGVDVPLGGSVFMSVIQKVTNPTVTALAACAVIYAIISTAISLINAISSNMAQDFTWSSKKGGSIGVAQVLTAAIALTGIAFSYSFSNIVSVLILSYDLSISCLFVPVLVALTRGKGSKFAAWTSFFVGAIAFFIFRVIPYEAPKELLCIFLSGIGYYIGSKVKGR